MLKTLVDETKDFLFEKIHSNNLIYNTCWEDPRCDRTLMEIDNNSSIVMITSAGCNALDYLLDNPASIDCIDMNKRQNALLELKRSFFVSGDHDNLFKFFGAGQHPQALYYYSSNLRRQLPDFAKEYWDQKLERYFSGNDFKGSFYFHGTSGTFAWVFYQFIKTQKTLKSQLNELLSAPTLDIQEYWYNRIEDKIVNRFTKWAMKKQLPLALLGVPRSQTEIIEQEYPGGMAQYVKDSLRRIFTQIPIKDNYFWQLYLNGHYTEACCPNYLKPAHFEQIKQNESKISTHTTTFSSFLKNNPKKYSHYVLLDHQDWLAANDIPALEEEWKLILQNSRPGTKILMRSGAISIQFLPEFVKQSVEFDTIRTIEQHQLDRVGTYGSVYLLTVKQP